MRARLAITAAALALVAGPAVAVGFGPLRKEGVVDGPSKAFYLTIVNPYDRATDFVAYPVAIDSEAPAANVRVFPDRLRLGAGQSRRVIAIVDQLEVGPAQWVRVCAERAEDPEGTAIHARVCSRLGARRVDPARG